MEKIPISEKLQGALLKANDLKEISDKLFEKTKSLSSTEKENLPEFTGLWDKELVEKYLNRLEESIDEPLLSKSRGILEQEGISSEKIPRNILKEIETIKKVVDSLKALVLTKDFVDKLKNNEGGLIRRWLIDETAIENLKIFVDSKNDIQNIFQNPNFSPEMIDNITDKIFKNPSEISDIVTKSEELNTFIEKIIKKFELEPESNDIDDIMDKSHDIFTITEEIFRYGFTEEDIKSWVSGKNINDTYECLKKRNKKIEQKYYILVNEFKEIVSILKSMGHEEIDKAPQKISDLNDKVDSLRQLLVDKLGDKESKLLDFLLGKTEDFPKELSFKDVKGTLGNLRPLLSQMISKNRGGSNAKN